MTRLMADDHYRADQWTHRYDEHVAPINRWIDAQHEADGWMPYVAPVHGGVGARVLSVLRDPGPKTLVGGGSGFVSVENDDPTAAGQAVAFDAVGIPLGDLTPWNIYPWYINRAPSAAERREGLVPLRRLVGIMPRLRVVLLQGRDAQAGWRALVRRDAVARELDLVVIETYHPGRQALFHPDPVERSRRVQHRLEAYASVRRVLDDDRRGHEGQG